MMGKIKLSGNQLKRIIMEAKQSISEARPEWRSFMGDDTRSYKTGQAADSARKLGIKAAKSGQSIDDNPFEYPKQDFFAWEEGFHVVSELRESKTILLEYEQAILRRGGDLYLVNDEGEEEYYGDAQFDPIYGNLEDGEAVPYDEGGGGYVPHWRRQARRPQYGRRKRW